MEKLVDNFFGLFSEFTWKKFFALLVILALGLFGVSLYERYTSSFRFARLQRSAELLLKVHELEAITNKSPDLKIASDQLLSQATEAIKTKPLTFEILPTTLKFSMDWVWRFLAGGSLFALLSLTQVFKLRDKKAREFAVGFLVLAVLVGIVGVFVPAFWWPWFHILIYPWLFVAALLTALVPVGIVLSFKSGLKKARDKASAVSCINNLKQVGLAARIWASDHGGSLPPDFASMREELGTGRITRCPCDDSARYEILSPLADISDPATVFARCQLHNVVLLADGSVQALGETEIKAVNGKWIIPPNGKSEEKN